jgi:hypothetical protein
MIQVTPPASDIINASATATTAGMVTIPVGRYLSADVQISASISAAGTSVPHLAYTIPGGVTGAAPVSGSILSRLSLTGLALSTVTDSNTTEIFVYGGDPGSGTGCTLDFTAGATGTSSITINGFLI